MFAHEIFDDPADQGQRTIRFFDRELLFHALTLVDCCARGQVLDLHARLEWDFDFHAVPRDYGGWKNLARLALEVGGVA
jgi:hypothetical protein